jgi:hypothetical protein
MSVVVELGVTDLLLRRDFRRRGISEIKKLKISSDEKVLEKKL